MSYLALKYVHVGCVVISYVLFFVRGIWMMHESPWLVRRWVRIMPHVVDTLLLASAIALAVMIGQYPFTTPWLTAKVIGLVVYIVLGMMALRRGSTRRARAAAWIAAQAVFFYIVAVALTKDPLLFRF
jgi:uncharacterized membrane protein SirB2